MKKLNTSPISGMQELLPADQAIFNKYKEAIREVYRHHGFLEIETPTIDRAEILFAKAGGETEKQIYKVYKTDEDPASANEALRFDHTVPLARYVAEHESNLDFPFKVTQVGRNFRGERAQKGRFREFYQCDIDVIGRNSLPITYDAEVILTLYEALHRLTQKNKLVRISNRKIVSGFLEALNLQEVAKEIFSIIDHAEKVEPEKVEAWLAELNIGDERVAQVLDFMNIAGDEAAVRARLEALGIENETFKAGLDELSQVMKILASQGLTKKIVADMKIVRGLDYYTGTVFETILVNYPQLGSICSGGRYENLAELYSDQKFPGVGGSIGLTRLFSAFEECGLADGKTEAKNPVNLAIIPLEEAQQAYCMSLAQAFRNEKVSVDTIFSDKKLGDRIRHAAQVARKVAIIGETEAQSGIFNVKDLTTGELTAKWFRDGQISNVNQA